MKAEFVREQPVTPPLKEVVIRLTIPEARLLSRVFNSPITVLNAVVKDPCSPSREGLRELLVQIGDEFQRPEFLKQLNAL